jgi:hypothetical protein
MSASEGAEVGEGVMDDSTCADPPMTPPAFGHLPSFAREEALPAI